ncbi:hypothetical protein BDV36DRAFT_278646 [Aspergillus pseudocaelatus]|uniref:Uncharacterized protein n=1 Tax=Aspergillus pseudocaelatus TaxID=1825620 RepID=A0ABQ6VZ50_9EURO|nr:hypothetical protein BDV36DRAFT_278646 [Aspergillus pseudocaelatus]
MDGFLVFDQARRGFSLSTRTPYFFLSFFGFPSALYMYVGIPVSVNVNRTSVGELRPVLPDLPC